MTATLVPGTVPAADHQPEEVIYDAALCGICGTGIVKGPDGWDGCDVSLRDDDFDALIGHHKPYPVAATIAPANVWDYDEAHAQLREHLADLERQLSELTPDEQTGTELYKQVARLRTASTGEPFRHYVSHLRAGDVVTFDGDGERVEITKAWWNSKGGAHMFTVDDDPEPLSIPAKGAPTAVLHFREGVGGLRETYDIGDRVSVWVSGCVNEWRYGVVVGDFSNPASGLGYEVMTIIGGKVYTGPEDMRRDRNPAPEVGQLWETVDGRRQFRITAVREHGLIVGTDCALRDIVPSDEHFRPVADPARLPVIDDSTSSADADSWGAVLAGLQA